MTDVFLSYKREDKAYARALAEALARRGLDVWWDVDLLPGERFAEEIEQVIERAKVAVVLWSARSIHSDYVLDKARLAKERGILVRARIDASQPPPDFRTVQTEDLSAWDGAPASPVIAGLVDAVARRAGKASEPEASDAETADHLHSSDAEAKLWESIRSNSVPSIAEYRLYLDRYPQGLFADLARLRIERLKGSPWPGPMKLVAGATAVVVLVLALLLVPPRFDEARSTVAAWFPEASPRPEDLAELANFTDALADGSPCDFCPEMVVIPAGTFTMGSPPDEDGRQGYETPQRQVRVERFAMGRTEVTLDQFAAFVDATGHEAEGCSVWSGSDGQYDHDPTKSWRDPTGFEQSALHPAACVSWNDAQAYVAWLGEATGAPYRLPSEAEWEYAARAGTTTRYAFGDELSQSEANFGGNVGRTWEVGSGAANNWSLLDMHGNLWEWVEDCRHWDYDDAPGHASPRLQHSGGDCSLRVVRGGSWYYPPEHLRSATRSWGDRDYRYSDLGFRVARTLTP